MEPFLKSDLESLLSTLPKLFIKPTVIAAAKTASSLINIDISKASNQTPSKDLDLRFAAEAKLKELRSKDLVSVSQEVKFREKARTFLTYLVSKLFERTPLDSVVVRSASISDPKIMIDYSCEKIEKILRNLLHHLMSLNIISAPKCNKVVQQLTSFHKSTKSSPDKFIQFSRSNDSLDSFYFSLFPNLNQSHLDLSLNLKLILVFSHGQASVECGFSLRNATLKDNIPALSLDSKRLTIDHVLYNNSGCIHSLRYV